MHQNDVIVFAEVSQQWSTSSAKTRGDSLIAVIATENLLHINANMLGTIYV